MRYKKPVARPRKKEPPKTHAIHVLTSRDIDLYQTDRRRFSPKLAVDVIKSKPCLSWPKVRITSSTDSAEFSNKNTTKCILFDMYVCIVRLIIKIYRTYSLIVVIELGLFHCHCQPVAVCAYHSLSN